MLRVSRSRRCLQLTLSSTLERTASDACEDGSGASPMVAAARGAAGRDGGQAAPWDRGMWHRVALQPRCQCAGQLLVMPGARGPAVLGVGMEPVCLWVLLGAWQAPGAGWMLGSTRTLFEVKWLVLVVVRNPARCQDTMG